MTLSTAYPTDVFDSGVQGAPVVTSEGVSVPASLVTEIEAIARKYGVKVVQILVDDTAQPVARFFKRVATAAVDEAEHVVDDIRRI